MLFAFGSWLVWLLIFCGIGLLLRRSFGLRNGGVETLLLCFWAGWSCTLLILQVWHLWFRIDQLVQILVAIAGLIGIIWNRTLLWGAIRHSLRARKAALVLVLILGIWLANHVSGPLVEY